MQRRDILTLLAAPALSPLAALAQPSVTKLLVGATPGGGTDIVARLLANELGPRLKRQVIVENRPGAAGNIAAAAVAKAEPDAGTLLLSYTSHAINASLFQKLPFDPVKDFTAICLIASSPLLLVTRPGLKADNMAELIRLAKAEAAGLTLAVAGVGSANHLAGEMLKVEAGIKLVSVPYKGAGPAVSDVMAGQVDLLFSNMATVQQLMRAGKVKALGVSSLQRLPDYPNVSAVSEVLPGFDYNSWYGLFGPAGIKRETAQQLGRFAGEAVASATMRERLLAEGLTPIGSGPTEFGPFVQKEIARWGKVVAATGAKPE